MPRDDRGVHPHARRIANQRQGTGRECGVAQGHEQFGSQRFDRSIPAQGSRGHRLTISICEEGRTALTISARGRRNGKGHAAGGRRRHDATDVLERRLFRRRRAAVECARGLVVVRLLTTSRVVTTDRQCRHRIAAFPRLTRLSHGPAANVVMGMSADALVQRQVVIDGHERLPTDRRAHEHQRDAGSVHHAVHAGWKRFIDEFSPVVRREGPSDHAEMASISQHDWEVVDPRWGLGR